MDLPGEEILLDYTLHKFRRHSRRESGQEQEGHDREASEDVSENPDAGKRSSSFSGSDLSPTAHRPKGILKQPTVRFKIDDNTKDGDGPAPPVFPPPLLPHNGHPLPGSQPILYDTMQPLPPGPPRGINPFTAGPAGRIDPAAYSLYIKFMDELEEFVSMQGSVIRLRVHVQERRTRLRLYRENVSRRDIDYMDHLRECKAKGTVRNDLKLEELFDAAQAARDEVGPEEDDYEALEIKLGAEEFALKEKYDSLESRFENFFRLGAASSTNISIPTTIEFEPPSEGLNMEERRNREQEPRQYSLFQGAFVGDKVKIGQHPVAGDEADNEVPTGEADPLPSNEGPASGPHISSDAHQTGRRNASLLSNVAGDETVEPLRDLFGVEAGDVEQASSASVPDFESGEVRMQFSLRGLDLPSIEETHESFLDDLEVDYSFGDGDSLLLLGTDSDTQSTLSDYLMQFDSTRTRVNRWLLHKLRVSPREVFELRRKVLETTMPTPDWANLALNLWEGDSSTKDRDKSGRRHETSPAPYPSTRDLPSRHRWRKKKRSSAIKANLAAVPDGDPGLFAFDPATGRYESI